MFSTITRKVPDFASGAWTRPLSHFYHVMFLPLLYKFPVIGPAPVFSIVLGIYTIHIACLGILDRTRDLNSSTSQDTQVGQAWGYEKTWGGIR